MDIQEIKKIIKQKKISYAKMAEDTNISRSTLADIFRGKTQNPRMDTLKIICDYLDLNEEDIYKSKPNYDFTMEEIDFINSIRLLTHDQKMQLKGFMSALLEYNQQDGGSKKNA